MGISMISNHPLVYSWLDPYLHLIFYTGFLLFCASFISYECFTFAVGTFTFGCSIVAQRIVRKWYCRFKPLQRLVYEWGWLVSLGTSQIKTNEKVLDKQYLSLVKVALTFEIKTWKLIDYCGFWIACLMRDMQLTYGDVMWSTVWEVLVVSYCKMIINDSTLYLMMLIISFSEELHLTRMCGLCEFEVAKPAVF